MEKKSADPKEKLPVQKATTSKSEIEIIPRITAQKFGSRLRRSHFLGHGEGFPKVSEIYRNSPAIYFKR